MDRYRILESVAATGVFCTDATGRELRFANARWRTLSGLRDDQALHEWVDQVHPEDRDRVIAQWFDAVSRGDAFQADYRFLGGERGPRWVRVEALPERDEAGVIVGYVGSGLDITTTHFEESLRDGQNLVLELIVVGAPLPEVLTALARAAESQAEGMACSVLLLDDDGVHLRLGAAPSLPAGYAATLDGRPIGPEEGSCGSAAFRRAPVLVSDIATDPRWDKYRAAALEHGLRACWSTPVLAHDGQLLGTFTLYYRSARAPEPWQRALMDDCARLAGIAIERERAQATLRESEQRYRQLYSSTPVMMHAIDSHGRLLSVNDAWVEKLGYAREEVLGRPSVDFLTPDSRRYALEVGLPTMFRTGACHELPYQFVTRGGGVVDGRLTAVTVGSPGDATRALAVIVDVTQQLRAEKELRANQRLVNAILEGAPVNIFVKDAEGRYLLANGSFMREMGFDLVGKRDDELFPPAQAAAFRESDRKVLETRRVTEQVEEVSHARGARVMLTVKSPLIDDQGRAYAVCGITTDITERHRLEEQLQRSQKMEALGRLASGVAHDFNNVLTAILGNAELLHTMALDADAGECVHDIKKAVQLASSLTRQLLTFSRRQVRELRVTDLNEVVTGIEGLLRHVSAEGVRLALDCAAAPVCVKADVGQLEQVLLNLVINAHDAMPGGGTVQVTTRVVQLDEADAVRLGVARPGAYASLEVIDSGVGITPEVRARLFEPFFSTKAGKGTGLGLATVYGITQQSGGYVLVDSEPGRGACFTVLLPHEPGVPPRREAPAPTRHPAARGAQVLVVDDDEGVRRVLVRVLREAGYDVLSAGDGEEALRLEAATRGPIHLLLSDVMMPGLMGPELARRFTARRPEARVILMSGNASDALSHVGELPAGALFMAKPLSVEQLTQTLRQLLSPP